MRKRTQTALAILMSLLFHLLVLLAVILFLNDERAAGEKYAVINIGVIGEAGEKDEKSAEIAQKKETKLKDLENIKFKATAPGKEDAAGNAGFHGEPGAGGENKILAAIKAKIESNKRYPSMARKMNIAGRPAVIFQINADGSLKFVNISNSSGFEILDQAAIATVKKSAPLPYYENPIKLIVTYDRD